MDGPDIDITQAFPNCVAKVFRTDEDESDWFCVTMVQEGRLNLETAQEHLQHPLPKPGERVYMQSALADAAYRLAVRVVESRIADYVTLVCKQESAIERIQRRIKHRLHARMPVRIERASHLSCEPLSLITEDLNSLGMRVLTRTEMELAESVEATLDLMDGKPPLRCGATVVRCRDLSGDLFEMAMRFQGLEKEAQERIAHALLRRLFESSRYNAKVFREDEYADADLYIAFRAKGRRLSLEASRDRLQHAVPQSDELIYVQSLWPDAAYRMRARVVECLLSNTVRLIAEQEGSIERIQRRRHYRVETQLPVKLLDITAGAERPLELVTRDVSTSGISFFSPVAVPEGHEVRIMLDIGADSPPVTCAATVTRCRKLDDGRFEHGLSFLDMREREVKCILPMLIQVAGEKIHL